MLTCTPRAACSLLRPHSGRGGRRGLTKVATTLRWPLRPCSAGVVPMSDGEWNDKFCPYRLTRLDILNYAFKYFFVGVHKIRILGRWLDMLNNMMNFIILNGWIIHQLRKGTIVIIFHKKTCLCRQMLLSMNKRLISLHFIFEDRILFWKIRMDTVTYIDLATTYVVIDFCYRPYLSIGFLHM